MPVDEVALRSMPKIELHVHFEGSIRPETVLELSRRNNVPLPAHDLDALRDWYRFRDFAHFVDVYIAITKCIKTADDLEFIAREFLQCQSDQNVKYSEVTFTVATIEKYCGIPVDEQIEAVNRARLWGEHELGVEMQLILDIVRGDSPERAMQVVNWVAEWLGRGVCALGIAGFEDRGTTQYADCFVEARRLGLPVTAHAGETQGAWSVRETLDVTQCGRIGHGVRSIEDPDLIRRLVDEQIVLEVCPTSNVCVGGVKSIEDHPIQRLIDAGVRVTLNSDDPPMFNTTLTDEWIKCTRAFGWEQATVDQLTETARAAAFVQTNS
jgi:adenosine deaminase